MESQRHPVKTLIGGPQGAVESMLPPVAFVTAYAISGYDLTLAVAVALGCGLALAAARLVRRERPVRVVGALLVVIAAAGVAYYTGDAAAYFWPLVLANLASALAFAVSIFIGWPLMGVIIGPMVATKMRWRSDPALARAYALATWPWVVLNLVRAVVQVPLIRGEQLWALAALRPLFYVLVILTVLSSWAIISRTLPAGHPGVRHPQADPPELTRSEPTRA